ncbi:MAG: tRNA (guanosine(37)-N1)-methyltransferase TrmD [Bacilli bacterium]
MKITILTLFKEQFNDFINTSIIKRAISKGAIEIEVVDIRQFTKDKNGRVDSAPIGGGAGLILKCQPVLDALASVKNDLSYVIMSSPRGNTFTQKKAHELASKEHLVIICGHYEGVDERVNNYVDEQVSIGDYILTGGELPAMVISDSIIRLLEGAITHESIEEESFENGLLEYPQYTEPYSYNNFTIPDILYTGNHKAIAKWRQKQSLALTRINRPDLFNKYNLTKQDKKLLEELESGNTPKWEQDALEKGKKFVK